MQRKSPWKWVVCHKGFIFFSFFLRNGWSMLALICKYLANTHTHACVWHIFSYTFVWVMSNEAFNSAKWPTEWSNEFYNIYICICVCIYIYTHTYLCGTYNSACITVSKWMPFACSFAPFVLLFCCYCCYCQRGQSVCLSVVVLCVVVGLCGIINSFVLAFCGHLHSLLLLLKVLITLLICK